jgi:ketosteroid isomerase-like protein
VIGHYAKEPEFRVFMDGKISDYAAYVSQAKADIGQASGIEGGLQAVTVIVLGPKVAAAVAPFREVIIDKAGQRLAIKGTVTWTWVRRGPEWKILYGHASHELDLDTAAVEKELRAMEAGHRAAVYAKDIEGILRYYSADLITIFPGEPNRYGNEWVRTAVADLYKAYEFHEDFKFIDIKIIGDRIAASYSFSQQMTPVVGGEKTETTGKGMCILKRNEMNIWQFEWNSYSYDQGGEQ